MRRFVVLSVRALLLLSIRVQRLLRKGAWPAEHTSITAQLFLEVLYAVSELRRKLHWIKATLLEGVGEHVYSFRPNVAHHALEWC